ncbi:MAG: SDR family NAD(P)-dependent oxidoreductase [Flavobacteriales bacterium]|nr:MAG: SDR family NAD(P)-dependent oxidoreductase [Flavobacteriales bacterium]
MMNSRNLKGKVALISGSSMGIGKAIASALAADGVSIILNGRDEPRLKNTETELRSLGYKVTAVAADIRIPGRCRHLVQQTILHYGRLDILINNAAVSSRGSVAEMADGNYKIMGETNFNGSAHLSKYAIPYLKETKGHIIFINSVGGFRGIPFNSAYSATKMAQAALAEALRIELFDLGIHVGVAFVGFTENDPDKTILDVGGSWVYLPKRTNIKLAKPQAVAQSIKQMIIRRKNRITLTRLGRFTSFATRYLPSFSNWLLLVNRKTIKRQFTMIGGKALISSPWPTKIKYGALDLRKIDSIEMCHPCPKGIGSR